MWLFRYRRGVVGTVKIRVDYGGLVRLLSGMTIRDGDVAKVLSDEEAEQIMRQIVGSVWFNNILQAGLEFEFLRAADDIERDAKDKKVGETVGRWLRARAALMEVRGGMRV